MQIDLFCVGKQDRQFAALVEFYSQRIQHYANLEVNELEVKNIRDEIKRYQLENEKLELTDRNGFLEEKSVFLEAELSKLDSAITC